MAKWAVISADMNLDYVGYLPFTFLWWRRLGYQTLVILVGNEEQWRASPPHRHVLDILQAQSDVRVEWVPEMQGHKTHMIAQVARIFAAGVNLPPDDFLLTSDTDMWPLSADFFNRRNTGLLFHSWYANAYHETPRLAPKYPICYLGGHVSVWQEIMHVSAGELPRKLQWQLDNGIGQGATGMDAWCYDELLFGLRLKEWWGWDRNRVQFISRDMGWTEGRIDRADWRFDGSFLHKADAHLLRFGGGDCNWPRLRELLAAVFPQYMMTIDRQWGQFTAARQRSVA